MLPSTMKNYRRNIGSSNKTTISTIKNNINFINNSGSNNSSNSCCTSEWWCLVYTSTSISSRLQQMERASVCFFFGQSWFTLKTNRQIKQRKKIFLNIFFPVDLTVVKFINNKSSGTFFCLFISLFFSSVIVWLFAKELIMTLVYGGQLLGFFLFLFVLKIL